VNAPLRSATIRLLATTKVLATELVELSLPVWVRRSTGIHTDYKLNNGCSKIIVSGRYPVVMTVPGNKRQCEYFQPSRLRQKTIIPYRRGESAADLLPS